MATFAAPVVLRRKAEALRKTAQQLEDLALRIEGNIRDRDRKNARLREAARFARLSREQRKDEFLVEATANPIIQVAAQHFNVTIEGLRSVRRTQRLAQVRFIIGYLLTKNGHSLTHAGNLLNRDHSSVVHGNRIVQGRMGNPDYSRMINKIWPTNGDAPITEELQ